MPVAVADADRHQPQPGVKPTVEVRTLVRGSVVRDLHDIHRVHRAGRDERILRFLAEVAQEERTEAAAVDLQRDASRIPRVLLAACGLRRRPEHAPAHVS